MGNTKPAKVLIVDDHPIVREGIARLIRQKARSSLVVCGGVDSASDAMEGIEKLKPDVVIVDIFLRGSDGIQLIKRIRPRYPDLPILVLSMHDESLYAERALKAGADGYIMKQESSELIIAALQKVLSGKIYASDNIMTRIVRTTTRGRADISGLSIDTLSDRELEVFQMLGHGRTTRQIADGLHISIKTVETYRERIKLKLDLNNSNELILHAAQWVNHPNHE